MVGMNFLAHLHLSDGTPESMLGNMLADLAKGPDVTALPPAVRAGGRLHRLVDGFTDRHPAVLRSIGRVSRRLGWFAGIVIDVYYDHILARNWEHHSSEPLRLFADRAYHVLEDHAHLIPEYSRSFVRCFIADDRLVRYATADGIAETLTKLSARIRERMPNKPVRLEESMPDLLAADAELEADFDAFYPELQAFAAMQRATVGV